MIESHKIILRNKLTTKFSMVTGLVILTAMVIFALYNINMLEKIWLKDTLREVDSLSEMIIDTTHYQMLEDHRQRAYQVIEQIAGQEGIERIRLFNKAGRVTFSSQKKEIGNRVDLSAEACNGCHSGPNGESVATEDSDFSRAIRSRFFINEAGSKILGVTREINNLPSCATASCHAPPEKIPILGILDVQVSLGGMQSTLLNYKKSLAAFTFLLLCVLGLSLSLLTQKFVKQPLEDILESTAKLAKGDFSSRVNTRRKDELGDLANAFDDMAEGLEDAHQELRNWGQTLETKVAQRTYELQKMQAQLLQSAKLASIGELVAGIAHEINNPLSGILLFSSLAAKHQNLEPELLEKLETIKSETQRCTKIVQGLLEFSRSSRPEKTNCSLAQIINETIRLIAQHPIAQNIAIDNHLSPGLPDICLDRGQIRQVFMNLLMNACQAMPRGGRLTLSAEILGEFAIIEVTDTGIGIEEKVLNNIFDPFFTTKEREGTGLGLSISYGIIENHGGRIEARSVPNQGTTFTVRLPISPQLNGKGECAH